MKHRIKLILREIWARLLFHTGLHLLVDRLMPRRLTILAGHCVTAPSNAGLPKDMKIAGEKLERMLRTLGRRYELTTVGGGLKRLRESGSLSLVALSMDDGYRDNATHLAPLLARAACPATVYLETRALDERRLNWSHKFFWILDRIGLEALAGRLGSLGLAPGARGSAYRLKRALKYDVDPLARNRLVDTLFAELGGDERGLCEGLYMTWDDARALLDAGLELGGHTVSHEILSRLPDAEARLEVRGCRDALRERLGIEAESFAYPFGRRWDYDARTKEAVRAAGFASATNTHAGVNTRHTDPCELRRVMIDEDARLHLVVAETCGGFELLRRIGIDLAE